MSTRSVRYQVLPRHAWPPTIPAGQDLTFDVADVAAPAMQEVLRTAAGTISLHAVLEELLVPQTRNVDPLIWLDDGVGVGIEMKRGFSGILGRFFARWYLQTHHGLTDFVPINGEGSIVSHNVIIRRTGQIHLPDWICVDAAGQPVLAESKGSHNKAQWLHPKTAGPLRKAETQLENAVVQIRSPVTGSFEPRMIKGWAVMSRWGTVENNCAPLLYALDPETRGGLMTEAEATVAARDISRSSLAGYMQALGHADLASRLATTSHSEQERLRMESDQAELDWAGLHRDQVSTPSAETSLPFFDVRRPTISTARIPMEEVQISGDEFADRRFVGGVVDLTGRLVPSAVSEIVDGRSSGPAGVFRNLYFAGVDVRSLDSALKGATRPILSPIRIQRSGSDASLPTTSVLSDGFILTPLDSLSNILRGAPESLTEPRP